MIILVQGGCNNKSTDSVTIEIRDSLYITLGNVDTNICLGQTVNIRGEADANIAINWTPANGILNPNIFFTSITPTTFGSQTYNVGGVYLTCPTVQRSFKITTDPVPILNNLPDIEICEGETTNINLNISPPFNYNINWAPNTNLQLSNNNNNAIFNGITSQNYTVSVVSPNANCSASESFGITVWPFVEGSISGDTLVCDGVPVPLFVSGGINQYLWYPGNTLSCTNCPNPIATSFGTSTYSVVLLEPHGCQDTLEVTVENHPAFNLQLLNNDTSINYGESVNLLAIGAPYYQWSPTMYLSSQISGSTTCVTPLQDVTYTVTGTSLYHGCPQTDTVRISLMHKDIFMPNVFTPNGDNLNDRYKPVAFKQIKALEYRIFNRWGQEVYSSNSIYDGWDGRYNGKDAEMGTYYYTLTVQYPSGFVNHYKGSLDLLR